MLTIVKYYSNATIVQVLDNIYNFLFPPFTGATVGHRSLLKYYKQNLLGKREGNTSAVTKVMAQYKALGWTGTTGN